MGFDEYSPDLNAQLLIFIMLLTGVFSGLTAHHWKKDGDETWISFVLLSTLATFTVPLFLQTISSNLIQPNSGELLPPTNYLIFSSLCLLVGFYAPRYLRRLLDRVLRDVEDTKKEATEAKEIAKSAQTRADTAFSVAQDSVPETKIEPDVPEAKE